MTKIVVDASIAVKWVMSEDDSDVALALLAHWTTNKVSLIAPILLASETTNILYRAAQRGLLSLTKVENGFKKTIFSTITFDFSHVRTSQFFARVAELARTHNLPATYDAHYLALAEREGCEFWTADARLYHAVREQLAWVRLMADDPAASTPA